MRKINVFLLLCVLYGSLALPSWLSHDDQENYAKFQQFMDKFGKKYSSNDEIVHRFGIFKENLVKIEKWQKEAILRGSKGMPGITKYADMSEQEFKSKMLMPPADVLGDAEPCHVGGEMYKPSLASAPPDTFNWTAQGAVTPVKDQGSVGTCWAFSTTGNIEGQWFLAGNKLVSLSEEQLNDCDGFDCGVFGGYPCRAIQYVLEVGGLMSEEEYPYCVGTGDCFPCSPAGYNETFCGPGPTYCNGTEWPCKAKQGSDFAASIKGYKTFPDPTDEGDLLSALYELGPLSVCLDAGSGIPPLQFHEWGVYDPWDCLTDAIDHAVLLVGYGTYGDTPYWLVKNSWGSDWSDLGGYFMIVRGSGMCGINRWPITATV